MSEVVGRFYFKKTSNGNLIGEFSNNLSSEIFTENADLIPQVENSHYVGNYCSTWREDRTPVLAKLEISHKNGVNIRIFSLIWRSIDEAILFRGEGMLCDDILIGNYWSTNS